ncbi:MAG: M20/M25/M40 family metallo-hydrolase [Deltaproteobacteria bacterium]|nr:M20/M25/M40 family metallo-hydrolase [Deltaproteobacteria bacterium]
MAAQANKILRLFYDLVAVRSDTCTPMERDIERFIYDWFVALSYFQKNPHLVGCEPVADDPLDRVVVWALVLGKGAKTLVLVNHHDAVLPTDYGSLVSYAFDPPALAEQMRKIELPDDLQRDLESGDWIFGRGTADMKAGAAIQMALTAEFSEKTDFDGNLLFLSVPGEEYMSIGMLNSVALMEKLQQDHDLDYQLLIDSETHQRGEDRSGVIYEGSAGKLLALVYVRGKTAHVGNVFAGFNPLLLLSEIILQTELNTDFCDVVEHEVAPPPTWMFMGDRQTQYESSVPSAAVGCLSVISQHSQPSRIASQLIRLIDTACQNVTRKIEQQQAVYNSKGITTEQVAAWDVQIRYFAEIFESAAKQFGQAFRDDYHNTRQAIGRRIDENRESIHTGSYALIEKVLSYIPDLSPTVVLAFLPPYYPNAANWNYPNLPEAVASLSEAIDSLSREKWGQRYKKLNCYMQISDMSFASFHEKGDAVSTIGPNMPFWDKYYGSVFTQERTLSMPVINIGSWGKDLHKFGERVYRPDLEERTYAIMKHAVQHVLEAK